MPAKLFRLRRCICRFDRTDVDATFGQREHPVLAIQGWRNRGHDVLSVRESMPGASDIQILAQAQSDRRLVVTQDKDFGELAFRHGLPADCGILLFRLSAADPDELVARMVDAVEERSDWQGHFSVVEDHRIRIRVLSPPASP